MLNGAIVGFGEVALNGHWPAYANSADFRIVAVVERTQERRALAGSLAPGLTTVASLDELATQRLDFIDICTPPALHAAPMMEAIERGWHVVCEKPFLLETATLERVRARAAAKHVSVVPVHNWKYAPILRAATAVLRSGRIGVLRCVEIETLRLRDCAAVDPEHPNWRRDPAIAGGGILMDHGWHAVYLALDWFGAVPTAVRAELRRSSAGAAEDEARLDLEFEAGTAAVFLSWNAAVRSNTMRLAGDRGQIAVNDDTLLIDTEAGRETVRFSAGLSSGSHHADWFATMLPDVALMFRDRARAAAAFEEAARTLSVIGLAYGAGNRE